MSKLAPFASMHQIAHKGVYRIYVTFLVYIDVIIIQENV